MKYYVRTTSNRWESVSENIFKDRKHAINDDGGARFGSAYIVYDETRHEIVDANLNGIGRVNLAQMCRFCGVDNFQPTGPTFTEPDAVLFAKGRSKFLMRQTGEKFKLMAK